MIKNRSRSNGSKGFTLTELMLAMAFLAFIMLFVVVVLIQTIAVYNKGMAMRQINQAGRQIGDDIARQMRFANLKTVNDRSASHKRLCIGAVTYVWNIGDETTNKYQSSNRLLHLIRITDPTQTYCNDPTRDIVNDSSTVTELIGSQAVVLGMSVNSQADANYNLTPGLIDISLVISSTGPNQPRMISDHWQCFDADGQPNEFCAFGEFNNTVYVRGF